MAQEATPTSTGLPEGITRPLASISSQDQSGLIAIIAAFSLGLILLSTATRIYVRHNLRLYRLEDFVFIAATIFAIVQSSLVFKELREGLGKAEDLVHPSNVLPIQKLGYAADIFYIVILFLSKGCVSSLFMRLTPGRAHMRAIWTTIVASTVWAIIAILLEAIRCSPGQPWIDDVSNCTNFFARWAVIAAMDATIEIALVANAIYLVSDLQMPLKSKLIVVGAFSWRIPNLAFTFTRLVFIGRPLEPASAHIWNTRVVCTTQLAIGYTITAAVIPYLKPFMTAYEQPDQSRASTYPSFNSTRMKLSKLTSSRSDAANGALETMDFEEDDGTLRPNHSSHLVLSRPELARKKRSVPKVGRLRPERTGYEVTATATEPKHHEGDEGEDSERLIITKNVEWSVEYNRDK